MSEQRKNYQQQSKLNVDQINVQLGKIPPQAIDVEQAVLGALMLERDAFHRISDILASLEKTVKLTTHFQFKLTTSFGAK